MGKRLGKRAKGPEQAPLPPEQRYTFGGAPPPLPRQAGSPASSTPLADYLAQRPAGVDDDYVVLPRSLVESMPLPWQQQLVNLLNQFHRGHSQLSWPAYRVVPSRRERLVDLDEDQLTEAGYLVEIDVEGEMIYRERNGREVSDPHETFVLVPCLDPIAGSKHVVQQPQQPQQPQQQPRAARPVTPSGPPTQQPQHAPQSQQPGQPPQPGPRSGEPVAHQREQQHEPSSGGAESGGPAPMNVGPQPVWPVQGQQPLPAEPASSDGFGEFGPTGEPTEIPYRGRWRS